MATDHLLILLTGCFSQQYNQHKAKYITVGQVARQAAVAMSPDSLSAKINKVSILKRSADYANIILSAPKGIDHNVSIMVAPCYKSLFIKL